MNMLERSSSGPILLMSPERIDRCLTRIAYQISEDNPGAIALVGINKKGYIIAQTLAEQLKKLHNGDVSVRQIGIANKEEIAEPLQPFSADPEYIVLTDDVIFSGRTMFTALRTICDQCSPEIIRTAVLVDRGHRKRPVKVDFSGLSLPTKLREHVSVTADEEKLEKVILQITI